MATNATRITRKLRQGVVDIDPKSFCALIVNYVLEIVNVDESGRVLNVLESKSDSKTIQIDANMLMATASKSSNIKVASIAAEVINSCKYIHVSRAEEVEQILIKLRKLVLEKKEKEKEAAANTINNKPVTSTNNDTRTVNDSNKSGTRPTVSSAPVIREEREPVEKLPPSRMSDLDDYLEMLYQVSTKNSRGGTSKSKGGSGGGGDDDGLRLQIRGTAMILQLCRDVMNLELLIQNSTLMGALARVLQEEYKKSIELTFNILRIFLAFSNFMEMHCLLADYRIGLYTLKTIEFEIKRTESREADHIEKVRNYERDLRDLNDEEDISGEERRERREKLKRALDADALKHKLFLRKQDKLLFVAFYILLNLAEDLNVEKKMIKKDIIKFLVCCLTRTNADLLVLVITFLKKISVFEDNKDAIKKIHETNETTSGGGEGMQIRPITSLLSRFVTCSSQQLVIMALRMLFNLSFDKELREQMIKTGILPKVVAGLKVPALRSKLLKLLYHLTIDDKSRAMFSYTDGIPLIMGMIINFPQKTLAKELAALGVNLSLHPKNAEIIVQNKGLNLLMDRLIPVEDMSSESAVPKDILLVKIIRNISQWTLNVQKSLTDPEHQYTLRGLWSPHIKALVRIALDAWNNHDVLVEIFGILANLTIMDLPANQSWAKMINTSTDANPDMTLLDVIIKVLNSSNAQPDLILETILLVSTVTQDAQACKVISKSNLIKTIFKIWKDFPTNEIEIHLQLLLCFYNLSTQEATQAVCFGDSRVLNQVIDYLSHNNEAVRDLAYIICERVAENDRDSHGELRELGSRIRQKRFEQYNQLWILETQTKRDSYDDHSSVIRTSHMQRAPSYFGNLNDLDDDGDDDQSDQHSFYRGGGSGGSGRK